MPSQVDRTAFQVGKNLALTPGAVVFKNEVLELIQYAPATDQVYRRPLLVVPPQINKFYVLDLAPGKSLIEYAVRQGIPTFAVSWRNPTPAQRDWGLETYMHAPDRGDRRGPRHHRKRGLNILGACSGGMTLSALLGHLAARGDRRINAATLLVTVLDTSVESQLGLFATPQTIAAAKAVSRARGVLDGREMARVFNWMRPNDLIWNYWVNNYLLGADPPAFDILYWNNDTTNLPARLHARPARPVPDEPVHASRHAQIARHADRSVERELRYLSAGGRHRPHHAMAGVLRHDAAHGRGVLVRLEQQRPYPEHPEPARQPESDLFHQPGAPRQPGAVAGGRAAAAPARGGSTGGTGWRALGRAAARAADAR